MIGKWGKQEVFKGRKSGKSGIFLLHFFQIFIFQIGDESGCIEGMVGVNK